MALDVTQLQATGTQLDTVIAAWQELLDGTLKGDTGRGISSITKSGETVTVTFTDNTSGTFTVPNGATGATGRGISSIVKSGETLTVTYTDNTTDTFTVLNGQKGDTGEKGDTGDPFTYADFTQEQLAGLVQGVLDAVENAGSYITMSDAQDVVAAHNDSSLVHSTLFAAKANASDLTMHACDTTIHVTSQEKSTWDGKYAKPSMGIPKTDLASAVQTSLGKADSALQQHQDISGKVDKVTGKGLSANDYDGTAKAKVDAIPANPKYTDTTYSAATTSAAGLMSAADKTKLNGIATGATAVSESTVSGWGFTKNTGAAPTVTSTFSGSPADNTIYNCTVSGSITITASSSSCPTCSSDYIITIGSGASVTLTAVSVVGDDISNISAGEIWEINILRGYAIVKKIKEVSQ